MGSEEQRRLGRKLQGTEFGRYHVGKKIGEGGYAWVYRATDLELERDCALKVLLPRGAGYSEELRERFMREAKLVGKLRDARSIRLYEADERDGLLFMVFEYVEGRGLDEVIEQEGALEPLRVAKILEQIMEALVDAHDLGIVHRDMKPGNVILYEIAGRADQVKVLDFGIGKFVNHQAVMDLTQEGMVMGTPRYMSPEQLQDQATVGSDIYSTGLVAYELLVGEPAVDAGSPVELMSVVLHEEVRLPDELKVPNGLRDIVHQMLKKDPENRYDDAGEVLKDLQVLRHRGEATREREALKETVVAEPRPEPTTAVNPSRPLWEGIRERVGSVSTVATVAVVVAVAVVGLMVMMLVLFSGDETVDTAEPQQQAVADGSAQQPETEDSESLEAAGARDDTAPEDGHIEEAESDEGDDSDDEHRKKEQEEQEKAEEQKDADEQEDATAEAEQQDDDDKEEVSDEPTSDTDRERAERDESAPRRQQPAPEPSAAQAQPPQEEPTQQDDDSDDDGEAIWTLD